LLALLLARLPLVLVLLLLLLLPHRALHAVWCGRGAGQVVAVVQQRVGNVLVLLVVFAVSVLCMEVKH
jgi:hypothetical protein